MCVCTVIRATHRKYIDHTTAWSTVASPPDADRGGIQQYTDLRRISDTVLSVAAQPCSVQPTPPAAAGSASAATISTHYRRR